MSSGEDEEEEGMGTSREIRRSPDAEMDRRVKEPRPLRRLLPRWVREFFLPSARSEGIARREALEAREVALHQSPKAGSAVEASSEKSGYEVYGEFIKDELEVQDKRKSSFEQRGIAVITTSGTLVTLLFALAALSTKKATTFVLPDSAKTWLSIALVLFFMSALGALVSNLPLVYQAVLARRIRERLRETPLRDADAAARDVAFTRLDVLESAKRQNGIKGWVLAAAMLCEALAVGCVAVAVWLIL